jgi:putative FmdB family regulatory protein
VPIYEYSCGACGRVFEKLVYGSAPAAVGCPGCESREVTRRLSVFGVKAGLPVMSSGGASAGGPGGAGGGCCGGGCGCR